MNCRPFSRVSAAISVFVGCSVLLGWWADVTVLKSLFPGLVEMNPLTAVAFILSGAALWPLRAPRFFAGAVILLAAVRLAGCLSSWDLGADRWLFSAALAASPTGIPNRMAPNTAAAFLLLGTALFLLSSKSRRILEAQFLSVLVLGISFLALLGYSYGAGELYGLPLFIPMAVNTAAAFFIIALGALCATADAGLMSLVTGGSSAGAAARRLLPMSVLVPAAFGWLALRGQQAGLYGPEFGTSLLVTAVILVFMVLIYKDAYSLLQMELELEARVEDRTAELRRELEENSRLQAQLVQSQKMEAVGRLAGGVAHDFNNILTAIGGYCQFLLDALSPADQMYSDVKEIKAAGDKAAGLTRQLLAFSRRQVLVPRVLDCNALISDIEKLLRRIIGEDVELKTVLAPGLGRIKNDQLQVEQVLLNLAINAKDAMPKGGRITIETADADLDEDYARMHLEVKPGRYVMLSVSDTGTGMDEATRAHLFEPFFTTKEQGKGTGLGLATVFGIVKQSGGGIYVYSEEGTGSVFKIYFPRVEEPVEAPRPRPAAAPVARGGECILLVEDDEAVRKFMARALTGLGYKVLSVGCPEEALSVSGSLKDDIQLLLTDVVMPKMHGPDLAERLSAARPRMKVMYMSGYTDETEAHRAIAAGGMPFLQKPIGAEFLGRRVREVLDG